MVGILRVILIREIHDVSGETEKDFEGDRDPKEDHHCESELVSDAARRKGRVVRLHAHCRLVLLVLFQEIEVRRLVVVATA